MVEEDVDDRGRDDMVGHVSSEVCDRLTFLAGGGVVDVSAAVAALGLEGR